jgi:GldM C-terminal domain
MIKNKIKIIFLLLMLNYSLFGQVNKFSEAFYSERIVLYKGIVNNFYLNTNVENNKWEVKASNGEVKILTSLNNYTNGNPINLIPNRIGKDTISFYQNDENGVSKMKYSHSFTVVDIEPCLAIGKQNKIKLKDIQALKAITITVPNLQYFIKYDVIKYKVIIIKNNGTKKEISQEGNLIEETLKSNFNNLSANDIIIFKDIIVKKENSSLLEQAKGDYLIVE